MADNHIKKLRFWCQMVLPLVYDDSLSYMELLNKIVIYLNNAIKDVSSCETNIEALLEAFVNLQNYVNSIAEDISPEIEAKIDEMIESGEFGEILAGTLNGVVSDEYDPTKTYITFDYAFHDGKLYRANGTTTGEWNSSKWDEKAVTDDLALLMSRVFSLNAGQVSYSSSASYDNGTVGKEIQNIENDIDNLNANDVAYNSESSYNNSTVGKELQELKGALNTKTDVNPFLKTERLISHQGGTYPTQSTDKAFEFAISQGFKIIEADLQKTSDDGFVMWHDDTYNGLTIASTTLADLEASTLADGSKLVSYHDFIQMCLRYGICGEIDLTHISAGNISTHAQTILSEVAQHYDSFYFTGSWDKLRRLQNIEPSIALCISNLTQMAQIGDGVLSMVINSRYPMISQAYASINSDIVAWAKEHSAQIKAYTPTTEEQATSAFLANADKIICENITPTIYCYEDLTDQITIYDERIEFVNIRNTTVKLIKINNLAFLVFPFHFLKTDLTANQTTIATLPTKATPAFSTVSVALRGTNANMNINADNASLMSMLQLQKSGSGTININLFHAGYQLSEIAYGIASAIFVCK